MSTIKTDAITAVSAGGDLSLDGLGTGGVSIASTLKMTKGGDISSASPLVIDTDGNYFDVTGTTNFSAMTVESGNFFMLQFDGALTITHGSGIELPGAANLTTATGDRLICYATAANTVEVMSVETEAASGGGAWEFVSSTNPNGVTNVAFTGFTSSYDYLVVWGGVKLGTGNIEYDALFGTGGTPTYQTSLYQAAVAKHGTNEQIAQDTSHFPINNDLDDDYVGGTFLIINPGNSFPTFAQWQGCATPNAATTTIHAATGAGFWDSTTPVTAVKFVLSSGNFTTSGAFKLYRRALS